MLRVSATRPATPGCLCRGGARDAVWAVRHHHGGAGGRAARRVALPDGGAHAGRGLELVSWGLCVCVVVWGGPPGVRGVWQHGIF